MRSFVAAVFALTAIVPLHQGAVQDEGAIKAVFQSVEQALASGAVGEIRRSLGDQVTMNIERQDFGYISANQATSVLNEYFAVRKPTGFSFSKIDTQAQGPFATGRLDYVRQGARGSSQVYLSLTRRDSTWVVSQFNIY